MEVDCFALGLYEVIIFVVLVGYIYSMTEALTVYRSSSGLHCRP